jgi:predicted RNA-binding Zn-ribbon protein involved in translation (DUF1610 family)
MPDDLANEEDFALNEDDVVQVTCGACGKVSERGRTWLRSSGTFTCPFCGAETELSHPEEN